MPRVLFYAELCPFRDSLVEHALVARPFLDLARALIAAGGRALLLANNETADNVLAHDRNGALHVLRLEPAEEARVQAMMRPWGAEAIRDWLDLVEGRGEAAAFVEEVLARVHARHPFDAVLGWSDNGAVARFCDARGIGRLHLELGPTRAPLAETIYFDARGTNALASFRDPRLLAAAPAPAPLDLWLAAFDRGHESEREPGLVDRPLTWGAIPPALRPWRDRRLAYLPLQLADDLNIQLGGGPGSPEAFLRHVLPPLRAAGFLPVVKPHPAAGERPFNILAEARALRVLREAEPDATLLLPATDAAAGQWLLANAALVVAVNSSVAFEAALNGTPAALVGAAAYDFASFPRFDPADPAAAASPEARATVARAVSLMLERYLYPSSLLGSPALARALLRALGDRADREDLAAALRRHLGPARDHHLGRVPAGAADPAGASAWPVDLAWFVGRPCIVAGGWLRVGPLDFALAPGTFEGRVESWAPIKAEGEAPLGRDGRPLRRVQVRGLAHATAVDRAPAAGVLLVERGRVVGAGPVAAARPDLRALGLPSLKVGFSFRRWLAPDVDLRAVRFVPFDLLRRRAEVWEPPVEARGRPR